jgi:hypothetical protein
MVCRNRGIKPLLQFVFNAPELGRGILTRVRSATLNTKIARSAKKELEVVSSFAVFAAFV